MLGDLRKHNEIFEKLPLSPSKLKNSENICFLSAQNVHTQNKRQHQMLSTLNKPQHQKLFTQNKMRFVPGRPVLAL
jgi:hypothetical protein